jgi:hypothetical protein
MGKFCQGPWGGAKLFRAAPVTAQFRAVQNAGRFGQRVYTGAQGIEAEQKRITVFLFPPGRSVFVGADSPVWLRKHKICFRSLLRPPLRGTV